VFVVAVLDALIDALELGLQFGVESGGEFSSIGASRTGAPISRNTTSLSRQR